MIDVKSLAGVTVGSSFPKKYNGIIHGEPGVFIEASSRGFRRFSAFFAYVNGTSIEITYQGSKKINGVYVRDMHFTNKQELFKFAKGKTPENRDECKVLYSEMWDKYIALNEDLREILAQVTAIGDMFGRPGSICQATELWRIRGEIPGVKNIHDIGNKTASPKQSQMSLF